MKIIDLILKNKNNHSFAHIITKTDPINHTKKNDSLFNQLFPNHSQIIKIGKRNISIGNNYSNAINNRLTKIGNNPDFIPTPRPWFQRIDNSAIGTHQTTNQMYLEYFYLSANKSTYSYTWETGIELTEQELTQAKLIFTKSYPSKKQEEAGLNPDQQIKINLVKIENIISIKAFGETATEQ
jgi:hypothetical protein